LRRSSTSSATTPERGGGCRRSTHGLVEEDAVYDAFDSLVDRSVVEHHVGGLAAELQGEPTARPRERAQDLLAYLGGPVNATLSTPGWPTRPGPSRPGTGEDVDDARRQLRLLE